MHQVLMRNVAIGEHNNVDGEVFDQAFEIFLVEYRNPLRIQASREDSRVAPSRDVRDLSSGKSNHLVIEVLPKENIKIVEVSARSSENENRFHDRPHRAELLCIFSFRKNSCSAGNHGRV
jgi:hypothetical protein